METGELAAVTLRDALADDDPRRLEQFSWTAKRILEPKYAGYRAAERWLSRPWVTDLLARRAQRSHFLRDALSRDSQRDDRSANGVLARGPRSVARQLTLGVLWPFQG